jgi:hypothetical protein
MKHKTVVETYNNLLRQMRNKIGKTITIYDPYGSGNIAVKEYKVTQDIFERFIKRRDFWLGGKK